MPKYGGYGYEGSATGALEGGAEEGAEEEGCQVVVRKSVGAEGTD